MIHVRRGWDQEVGEVLPKSAQGRRMPAALRDRLLEYLMDATEGRIFIGLNESYKRARKAAEAADVEPPTLHECRHGYASLMIAAGVNVEALSTFMGHANIRITLDQYGHRCPARRTRRPVCSTPSWCANLAGHPNLPCCSLHRTQREPGLVGPAGDRELRAGSAS